ncbi:MAG: hypothetical protein Q9218_005643 [Villophora microphyllina]
MRLLTLLLPLFPIALAAEVTTEYTHTNECSRKTQRGDSIEVHYRGTLQSDGSEFDASYNRGQPLSFTVGKGMVIKGGLWALFLRGLRLVSSPQIFVDGDVEGVCADEGTVFETELMGIQGVTKDEL